MEQMISVIEPQRVTSHGMTSISARGEQYVARLLEELGEDPSGRDSSAPLGASGSPYPG